MFGAGPIAEKSFRRLQDFELKNIVDNARNLWGKHELGVEIINPEFLKNSKKYFVVICTTSFNEVSEQLTAYGLTSGADFCVSPILNDLQIIDDLQNIQQKCCFQVGRRNKMIRPSAVGCMNSNWMVTFGNIGKFLVAIAMVLRNLAKTISLLTKKLEF